VDGQTVGVSVRPESIDVVKAIDRKAGAPETANVFEGDVESCDFQGTTRLLRVRVGTEFTQGNDSLPQENKCWRPYVCGHAARELSSCIPFLEEESVGLLGSIRNSSLMLSIQRKEVNHVRRKDEI